MGGLRRRLSYATVVSALSAFVVLAGGAAFAADQLARNSVGSKQLKKSSVTTAKIKKKAVTKAKIRNGAVDASRVKDGSLQLADLDQASLPFGHVVHQTTAPPTALSAKPPALNLIPLDSPSYTQDAGRDDSIFGAADVSFPNECEAPRVALVYVIVGSAAPDLTQLEDSDVAAAGIYQDEAGTGAATVRLNIGPFGSAGGVSPAASVTRTISVIAIAGCKSGATPGGTLSNLKLDVVGVK